MKALYFYARFAPSFTAIGYALRRPSWRRLPALDGQTWLVTGATGGIGRAVALGAVKRGATVIAVGRSGEKLAALAAEGGPAIVAYEYNLELVADNVALADRVAAAFGTLSVLVNNVGILNHHHAETAEGFEQTYGVNLLGPFALTERLLQAGALDHGAIVNVSSGGLFNAPLNVHMLDRPAATFNGFSGYASQKRAAIALSDHWTDPARDVVAYTMHPGWAATEGVRVALNWMYRKLGPILRTPAQGADTALWLGATRPRPVAGALWFDRKPRSAHAYPHTRRDKATPAEVIGRLRADAALGV